jgi:hypothetical protein
MNSHRGRTLCLVHVSNLSPDQCSLRARGYLYGSYGWLRQRGRWKLLGRLRKLSAKHVLSFVLRLWLPEEVKTEHYLHIVVERSTIPLANFWLGYGFGASSCNEEL